MGAWVITRIRVAKQLIHGLVAVLLWKSIPNSLVAVPHQLLTVIIRVFMVRTLQWGHHLLDL
uniref:Uncharacterized protein n=1 Tax=Arundo donax TaxID=35708 RepID=A0A0A9F7K8_ARUDO